MNRRDFLKYLLATPIAAELDVEKLLWVPGEKKIFIPEPVLPEWFVLFGGIPYHQSNASTGRWLGFERLHKEVQDKWVGFVKTELDR